MPKSLIRFLFLMFIMLNHAVSACESLVMHLPDENHPLSVLDGSSHQQLPQHLHQHPNDHPNDHPNQYLNEFTAGAPSPSDSQHHDDEHHASHAHVSCHISPMPWVNGDPAVQSHLPSGQYALITTSYTPDVPPPNLPSTNL